MLMKPILAAAVNDVRDLQFPLIATPKIDGIRALTVGGRLLTRSLKPVPNLYTRDLLKGLPDGLDGELVAGTSFAETSAAVMSRDGVRHVTYYVFDLCPGWTREAQRRPYLERLELLEGWSDRGGERFPASLVPWERLESLAALEEYETRQLEIGWEGICLRAPDAPYKAGRSTFKERALLKLKRFEDFEATVVGFEERQHNGNLAVRNRLGHLERSSAKGGLTPMGTLGALVCERGGVTFNVGTGFTDEARAMIWQNRERLLGRLVKVKSQPYGEKDRPRLPVFLGFRGEVDL